MDQEIQDEFNTLHDKIGRLIQSNHEDQIEYLKGRP